METSAAVGVLAALAQEHRFDIARLLVRAGHERMARVNWQTSCRLAGTGPLSADWLDSRRRLSGSAINGACYDTAAISRYRQRNGRDCNDPAGARPGATQ
jgi:hypothetical protein